MHILIETRELAARVTHLAAELTETYGERPLTVLGVMTGSLVLMADLIRQLEMPLKVGVMQARSYRGTATSAGELALNLDMMPEVAGQDVLVVDDIFDTGHTMKAVLESIQQQGPTSVRSLVLLSKSERHEVAIRPDFVGFHIPNEFVVGYGLDYQDLYRNLPFVAALEDHEIASHA
ncbi:hypoxanthine phosphoribosyltransferase [Bremerella sp. JC770]|uniref:hypoxanthine phosphoribosyltransferase n=1 Tax=Bremerella sp. JC770 TaxID=3232137 RepID=UPI0034576991